jgi:hypothetical protein
MFTFILDFFVSLLSFVYNTTILLNMQDFFQKRIDFFFHDV